MASKATVGFVGLGNMGNPMAQNLIKHGYPIIATDVFPESCKAIQDLGAQVNCFLIVYCDNWKVNHFNPLFSDLVPHEESIVTIAVVATRPGCISEGDTKSCVDRSMCSSSVP